MIDGSVGPHRLMFLHGELLDGSEFSVLEEPAGVSKALEERQDIFDSAVIQMSGFAPMSS